MYNFPSHSTSHTTNDNSNKEIKGWEFGILTQVFRNKIILVVNRPNKQEHTEKPAHHERRTQSSITMMPNFVFFFWDVLACTQAKQGFIYMLVMHRLLWWFHQFTTRLHSATTHLKLS